MHAGCLMGLGLLAGSQKTSSSPHLLQADSMHGDGVQGGWARTPWLKCPTQAPSLRCWDFRCRRNAETATERAGTGRRSKGGSLPWALEVRVVQVTGWDSRRAMLECVAVLMESSRPASGNPESQLNCCGWFYHTFSLSGPTLHSSEVSMCSCHLIQTY